MNTQINLLSDDELDAIAGGTQNNDQGGVHQYGVGALVRTGNMGTGNTGIGPFGVSVTGAAAWIVYSIAAAAAA
jgi:hypothetical protein